MNHEKQLTYYTDHVDVNLPSYPPNQSRPSPSNAARHICQEARLVLTSLRGGPPYVARGDLALGLKVRNCFVHHTRNNISSSSNNNNSIQAQLVTKQQLFFVTKYYFNVSTTCQQE